MTGAGWDVDERGAGTPVVLLPWFSLSSTAMVSAFEPVFAHTSGWHRLYVNLPGLGGTEPRPANADGIIEALLGYLDDVLGNRPVALAGCSYGGYLAAGLARQRPAQVSGLLLVCAGVLIRREDRTLPSALVDAPPPDWLADVPDDLREHFSEAIGNRTRSVAGTVARIVTAASTGDEAYLERLRANGYELSDEGSQELYDGPMTMLTGQADRVAGHVDQLDAMVRYPQGAYAVVPDAGHYLPFEQPVAFAALCDDWLDRVRAVT